MAGTIDLAKQAEALTALRLNGVRPRWPEQYDGASDRRLAEGSLNGVRPRWPEQCQIAQEAGDE